VAILEKYLFRHLDRILRIVALAGIALVLSVAFADSYDVSTSHRLSHFTSYVLGIHVHKQGMNIASKSRLHIGRCFVIVLMFAIFMTTLRWNCLFCHRCLFCVAVPVNSIGLWLCVCQIGLRQPNFLRFLGTRVTSLLVCLAKGKWSLLSYAYCAGLDIDVIRAYSLRIYD